jgi:lipopolysaccharide heptosyltransferase III
MKRVLAVRLDNDGDVLLAGPAVRALRAAADGLDLLVSPAGRAAAHLLPGVDEVIVFNAPWSGYRPPPVDRAAVRELVTRLDAGRYDVAVIFTSFHQSPLPMALLARLAGIPRVVADSEDYPGSLLAVRHRRREVHEVEAALELAAAADPAVVVGDRRLAVDLPEPNPLTGTGYVVVHPGASVPARSLTPQHARAIIADLAAAGHRVVVTGGPGDPEPGGDRYESLIGRTSFAELAAVLAGAACVVVGNTGPAHLAAAVGTPVVSLFSPVVPAGRWAPYGVPTVLLGDQSAPCRDTRARECPVPGHPCLSRVSPSEVRAAVEALSPLEVQT